MKNLDWGIQPFDRFGPIEFGIRSEDVRDVLGEPIRRYRKSKYSIGFTEMFAEGGDTVMIAYDEDDHVIEVEVVPPYDPYVENILLKGEAKKVEEQLASSGYDAVTKRGTMKVDALGFGMYVPDGDVIESVYAHDKNYKKYSKIIADRMFEDLGL